MMNRTGTAQSGHFLKPYRLRLSYQTHHFGNVSFSTLQKKEELKLYYLLLVQLPEYNMSNIDEK